MSVIKNSYLSERITASDLLPLSFLEMSPYTGQKRGLRFRLEKRTEETAEIGSKKLIHCFSWRGPLAFEHTEPGLMDEADFPFSDQGISELIDYLNKKLEVDR